MIREIICGRNLSGKSDRLANLVRKATSDGPERAMGGAVINSTPTSNFSGLSPTVHSEIELLSTSHDATKWALHTLTDLGFSHCIDRNPFDCSGGEQMVVAIIAALASPMHTLGVDGAMEQLSPSTREALLSIMAQSPVDVFIVDNRAGEWRGQETITDIGGTGSTAFMCDSKEASRQDFAVSIQNLSFRYSRKAPVFSDLNLEFKSGVFYKLSGPNGVGKSTLAKLITGLIKPRAGQVLVNHEAVKPWKTPGKFASYHFQNPDLQIFSNTIAQQIGAMDRAEAALADLSFSSSDHPLDLPFAMRKRLAIYNALERAAPFLILDEPTLGQDDTYVEWLATQVDGRTGFVITHSKHFGSFPEINLN